MLSVEGLSHTHPCDHIGEVSQSIWSPSFVEQHGTGGGIMADYTMMD